MTDDPGDKFLTTKFMDEPSRSTAEAAVARSCYVRAVRLAPLFVLLVLSACTETPSNFPPCVDPNAPCVVPDAGADASEAGVPDAPVEATPSDAR
jgi:hypothetical protein